MICKCSDLVYNNDELENLCEAVRHWSEEEGIKEDQEKQRLKEVLIKDNEKGEA